MSTAARCGTSTRRWRCRAPRRTSSTATLLPAWSATDCSPSVKVRTCRPPGKRWRYSRKPVCCSLRARPQTRAGHYGDRSKNFARSTSTTTRLPAWTYARAALTASCARLPGLNPWLRWLKVGSISGLQHLQQCLPDQPVHHRRDAQLALATVRFGNHHPAYRHRPVPPCQQLFADLRPPRLQQLCRLLDVEPVHTRRTLVGLDPRFHAACRLSLSQRRLQQGTRPHFRLCRPCALVFLGRLAGFVTDRVTHGFTVRLACSPRTLPASDAWPLTFPCPRSLALGWSFTSRWRPRRPRYPATTTAADSSLRHCPRPFRHKARAPQVIAHTFIAQPPHLRHLALITRASRLLARSPSARQRLLCGACSSARDLRSTLPPHTRSPSCSCASLRSS